MSPRGRLALAITPLTITAAMIAGPITGEAAAAPASTPAAIATPAVGTIYTADPTPPYNIFGFAPSASGNVAPVIDITGSSTDLDEPTTVAPARNGAIWVGGIGGAVLKFAATANGNVAPVQDISGDKTDVSEPSGIAVAADGSIWVASQGADTVERFAANATGNVKPLQRISGVNTGFHIPRDVALTPDGRNLWVIQDGSLREFPTTASGNVAPTHTISGPDTNLGDTEPGILVAEDNSIWASNYPVVNHYPAGSVGDVTPTQVSGAATGLAGAMEIRPDAFGNVWVGSPNGGSVVELPPTASGNTPFTRRITGASTKFTSPWGAAVYGYRPTAVRHLRSTVHHAAIKLAWHPPLHNGGAIGLYIGQRKLRDGHRWHTAFGTKALHFTDRNVSGGKHYVYRVAAINGYGYGAYRATKIIHASKSG